MQADKPALTPKLAPFALNWGIISTCDISISFAHHLPLDPTSRNTREVKHKIAAVGSHSVQSDQAFIEDVHNDPDVTAVYLGTPHVPHHCNAKDALLAGKHVLLEKPACLEVEELDELIKIAKEMSRFFMGVVWTPLQRIT
uniref:D-xylose 1-dehydrogenase (NADP(+), D-xylono-1,5-lactone-forming) n=1 Tax=Cryptococcus bacillisporus CA1280 TaxID=1296109 RepID=A0A0D0U755_CRYGA|nr:hypothetical protein I312_06765 [Cryptococcus bacillisporus CA1280]